MRELAVVVLSVCLAGCGAGPSGPSAPSPPATQPTPAEGPLSGRWIGPTTEELGIVNYTEGRVHNCAHTCVDYCRNFYDVVEATLSHQGTRLTGTLILRNGGAECLSGGVFRRIPASDDSSRPTRLLNMSVTPPGTASVAWADAGALGGDALFPVNHDLVGTYTANAIDVSGEREEDTGATTETWSIRLRLRRP